MGIDPFVQAAQDIQQLQRYTFDDADASDPFNTGERQMSVSWSDDPIDVQILTVASGEVVDDAFVSDGGGAEYLRQLLTGDGALFPTLTEDRDDQHAPFGAIIKEAFLQPPLDRSLSYFLTNGASPTVNDNLELEKIINGMMRLATPLKLENPNPDSQSIHPISGLLSPDLVYAVDNIVQSLIAAGVGTAEMEAATGFSRYGQVPKFNTIPSNAALSELNRALDTWRDLPGTAALIDSAIEAIDNARVRGIDGTVVGTSDTLPGTTLPPIIGAATPVSLQHLIRFEYVQRGHDMIFNAMTELHTRLGLVEQTTDLLNSIQDVMNQKSPESAALDLLDLYVKLSADTTLADPSSPAVDGTDGTDIFNSARNMVQREGLDNTLAPFQEKQYINAVTQWEAEQFDRTLKPETNAIGTMLSPPGDPDNIFDVLERNFPDTFEAFVGGAPTLNQLNGDAGDAGSILQFLAGEIQTLKDKFVDLGIEGDPIVAKLDAILAQLETNGLSLTTYIADFGASESDIEGRGVYQRAITSAVIASQGQNDAQKEQLRRRMFEFEEFIKSASSLILKISQIIEKMAQGVRGV